MRLDISELTDRFPDFAAAALVVRGMTVAPERDATLDSEIAAREAACRAAWGGRELADIPAVKAWRLAYKGFGIKSTSYRSSVERLVKNVLADRRLAFINSFVDAYNAASLKAIMPIGADDLGRVTGDIAFRYARPNDSFIDMAGGDEGGGLAEDPPKEGEVVFTDDAHILCRRWNWRQDARSLITTETRDAILTVQSNGIGDLAAAAEDARALILAACGGTVAIHYVSATRPTVEL